MLIFSGQKRVILPYLPLLFNVASADDFAYHRQPLRNEQQSRLMFRLNQKHSRNLGREVESADGRTIVRSQSLRGAMAAALLTVLLLNLVWMFSSALLNRIFPWVVIIQGILAGIAVRRWGRGLDWRYPGIAAVAAWAGAYSGNFLLAADAAADDLGTGTLNVIFNMSEWTIDLYLAEVVSPVDHIYALCAAAVAAFMATRRLTRAEEYAIRTLGEHDHEN